MDNERRGLRFPFTADGEIAPANSLTAFTLAQVTEISLRGCFLKTYAKFELQAPVVLKIYKSGEYFEAEASVLYVNSSGLGLVFNEVQPLFRAVLQQWVLAALDKHPIAQLIPD
jgi:PilZ domain